MSPWWRLSGWSSAGTVGLEWTGPWHTNGDQLFLLNSTQFCKSQPERPQSILHCIDFPPASCSPLSPFRPYSSLSPSQMPWSLTGAFHNTVVDDSVNLRLFTGAVISSVSVSLCASHTLCPEVGARKSTYFYVHHFVFITASCTGSELERNVKLYPSVHFSFNIIVSSAI